MQGKATQLDEAAIAADAFLHVVMMSSISPCQAINLRQPYTSQYICPRASSSQCMACLLASRGAASASSSCPELDTHLRSAQWGESFMWDLPTQYASQQAAGGTGNADACLIFIRPQP